MSGLFKLKPGFELQPLWKQGANINTLMGKSDPAPPPPAPDYAAANKAAIDTDIATLPQRNAVNAAAQVGGVYADGHIYSADEYQKALDAGQTFGSVSDFRGGGTADINHQVLMQQLNDAPGASASLLALQQQYGPAFAEEARKELQATDPTGFALRDQFGNQLATGSNSMESLVKGQQAPQYEKAMGSGPKLKLLGGGYAQSGIQSSAQGSGMGGQGGVLAHFMQQLQASQQARPAAGTVDATGAPVQPPGSPTVAPEGPGSLPPVLDKNGNPMATTNTVSDAGTNMVGPSLADESGMPLPPALDKDGNPVVATKGPTSDQPAGATTGGNMLGDMQRNGQLDATGAPVQQPTGSQGLPAWLQQLLSGGGQGGPGGQATGSNNGTDGVPTLQDDPQTAALRQSLQTGTQDQLDISNSGATDPTLLRAAQQAARARGASSGNLLGDSAGLQEALDVQLSQQQRGDQNRANALGLLSSGQSTAGAANAYAEGNFQNQAQMVAQNNDASNQAYQNAMGAISQRNTATSNTFGAQQGLIGQQAAARQQDNANTQSFLGLQPIVSQGAQLSGLQSGAAPFVSGGGYTASSTNPGAGQLGAEWAGQLYGTQNAQIAGQAQASAAQSSGNMAAGSAIAAAAIIAI